ncbi:FadR/GntR family transcriptional regulator [Nakamurella leprariae]|uniref:FadR family transcriptional regulator n=1 Tax=Nakamurella leprariae TaxID=2803911 RepID=A0A938YF96_9ACTN|nr:FadR/GntR family transcriptional regulator [Nakamurella leprariae]MBM9468508.1 FadR family transcriptional regulator [Nakamurella leprariae]
MTTHFTEQSAQPVRPDRIRSAGLGPAAVGETPGSRVERWLRRQIVEGHWPINSQIPTESELIEQLGVSRSTLRESLRVLVHLGMLESGRGRGTWVRALSPVDRVLSVYLQENDGTDIVEVRRALEIEASGLAASRRTEADLAALHASLDASERVSPNVERGRVPGDFHFLMVRSARNQLLSDMYAGLIGALRTHVDSGRIRRRTVSGDEVNAEHRAILAAIEAGDPDRARAECAAHTAREYVLGATSGAVAADRAVAGG